MRKNEIKHQLKHDVRNLLDNRRLNKNDDKYIASNLTWITSSTTLMTQFISHRFSKLGNKSAGVLFTYGRLKSSLIFYHDLYKSGQK